MQTVSRLITSFIPEHYTLSLNLEREQRTFSGLVDIRGISPEGQTTISLHAKDLTITSALVDGKEASFTQDKNDELVVSHPDITTGKHIVTVAFSGTITDAMHGLYPCYYEHDGIKKELLATQFESHHAREVFPCIDEPEAKATFDLTLTTEPNITVLGNMPIKIQRTEDKKLVTIFNTTPRMSTYLLAWATGELHKKSAKTQDGVEVNIWATPAQKPESLDYALTIATRTIDFFNDYFGTPYPLPKSDHIALPDFSSGAMENWGLITYREMALLADPAITSVSAKRYIAKVIAHELSHQWFGNLVTMKWWNNLWLNESFANLMEYIALDALFPEWNIWLDFSTHENIPALRRDSIDGVQAVQVEVNHPDEIGTLFDGAIVYAKGSRLLRMLQHYIGNDAFQAGLKAYFAAHAYANTEANDLWHAFAAASGKDVTEFMNAWISQPGYPVVSIEKEESLATLSQKQFFIGPHQPSPQLWPIPLDASSPDIPSLLETTTVTLSTSSDHLYLNESDSAHFITKYGPTQLDAIMKQIESGDLAIVNRLQFLHEQTLLARGGEISTAHLIPLLLAYKAESNEGVWDIMGLTISELKKFVETSRASEIKLKKLAVNLAQKQYERLGWQPKPAESEFDTRLRGTIVSLMLYGEDPEAIALALELYRQNDLETLDPELRPLIITAAVRYGNDTTIAPRLLEHYKKSVSADLKSDITSGLAATRSPETIALLLRTIKDAEVVRPQDVLRWFIALIRTRDGRAPTWQWLQDNWQWITANFGGDKSYDYFPRFTATALMTRKELEQFRTFFTPMLSEPALTRVITLGISDITGRVELLERDTKAVHEALAKL